MSAFLYRSFITTHSHLHFNNGTIFSLACWRIVQMYLHIHAERPMNVTFESYSPVTQARASPTAFYASRKLIGKYLTCWNVIRNSAKLFARWLLSLYSFRRWSLAQPSVREREVERWGRIKFYVRFSEWSMLCGRIDGRHPLQFFCPLQLLHKYIKIRAIEWKSISQSIPYTSRHGQASSDESPAQTIRRCDKKNKYKKGR